jgi:hypothetical protein
MSSSKLTLTFPASTKAGPTNTFNNPTVLPRFCAAGVGRFRLRYYFLP